MEFVSVSVSYLAFDGSWGGCYTTFPPSMFMNDVIHQIRLSATLTQRYILYSTVLSWSLGQRERERVGEMRAATRLCAAVLAAYTLTAEAFAFAPPTSSSVRPLQQQRQHLRLNCASSAVAEGHVVMKGEQLFGSMVRGGERRPSVALRASEDGVSDGGGAVDFGAIAK